MKLKTLFASIQWVNLGVLVLSVLNQWTSVFPGVDMPPWALKVQILLGVLLTSVGGIGHRLAYGEAQTPADRTSHEIVSSAQAAAKTLTAATPAGETVTVPTSTLTIARGTGAAKPGNGGE